MKADLGVEMKEVKHASFKVSNTYCEKNKVSKRAVVSEILSEQRTERKEERYSDIDYFYDSNIRWDNGKKITIKQWLEILRENGVEVSIATFKSTLVREGLVKERRIRKYHYQHQYITIIQLGLVMILFQTKTTTKSMTSLG